MFNPSRLSLARQRRQFTKKSLAESSGLTSLTLTRLENGETLYPSEETVLALARVLKYPSKFFYGDDIDKISSDTVSFRSLSTLTAKQKDAAIAAGEIALMINDWVSQKFQLPKSDLPNLTGEDPVVAASIVRTHWGIGAKPISAIIKLFESKGIRVFSLEEKNKNVNAFSCWKNETPYIFLNTYKSAESSRFDAAHELGHLVLHVCGTFKNKDNERDADKFASAFLMPADDVLGYVPKTPSIKTLIKLKSRWGVSLAALARSTFEIGLSSDWHYRDLCKNISFLGYRTDEPNPIQREYSTLWRMVFESLWKDGITKNSVADEIGIPIDEIFSLLAGVDGSSYEVPPVRKPPKLSIV